MGANAATTESVILLQPHYIQVWRYLGWNLAWNVSAEWTPSRTVTSGSRKVPNS